MPAHEPLVSVIIPTYNREGYLREAVASVFRQTYENWELIIVDDASTDGTQSYLRTLTDQRVQAITVEHCANPARLRNLGITRAAGAYVAFLDSDDVWMPEKLAVQLRDLREHPDHQWGYTFCDRIDQHGAALGFPRGTKWQPAEGWILPAVISLEARIPLPTVMVTRDAVREIGGFDETLQFWEDYDVWVRLAMRSPARCLTRPLTLVRDHPGSNTKGRVEALESWVQVSAKLERDRELRRLRPLCRRQHALAAVTLATYYRVTGSYGRAFRTLLRAFPSHPAYPAWWLGLAKTCLRPLLPPTALRVYRRLRARIDQRTA